ncbi:hypothetical protein CHS0354_002959 [Potamilus streckersoni]|uniref:HECT domain-containing protein n=1 Tax=Potamilus streckersoni TaxID=2493646 RepID=A0AAE0VIA5_9BIVA|nr:hypothetical protein CHS0354_002959 [Potamilus streckersoni]
MRDDKDFILVPEEAWNKLMGWYGLTKGQEPVGRKVITEGYYQKQLKIEIYPVQLKLCQNKDLEHPVSRPFSRADTIDDLEKEMRRTFNIAENKEVRLWNRYTTNTYEQLTSPEKTLQDAGLYQGQIEKCQMVIYFLQVIVIEVKNDNGTWPIQAKRSGNSYNSSSSSYDSGYSGGYSYQERPSRSDIQPSLISEKQPLSCITEQVAEELSPAQQVETLTEILTKLESRVVTSRKNIVNVHRDNVLDGGFRAFGRNSFDMWCELHVRFSGEDGVDAGGPQREFMRLAIKAIKELPIFNGPDNAKILVYDQKCLTEGTYYKAGQMLAYFIVHRGPCPNFISPTLYSALAEGIAAMQPTPDEILDDDLREQVKLIADASSEKYFKTAVFKAVELINRTGCTNLTLQFTPEKQTTLVKSLTKFVVCERILIPFEQFENGLQTMGLVDEIKKNKQQWREVFVSSTKPLHALQMDSLFAVKWSAEGSNRKRIEERILVYWRDFLQDLEEGEGGMSLTLKDLLAFTTGADEVPLLGFPYPPQLSFTHPEDLEDEGQLCSAGFPYANMSSMELKIPVLDDYNTFRNNMATAISKRATLTNQ